MATPVRRLFLWKKLNAVNLAKLGSNCNLQPEEKRQLQKSGHWLLWDKSTGSNRSQPSDVVSFEFGVSFFSPFDSLTELVKS